MPVTLTMPKPTPIRTVATAPASAVVAYQPNVVAPTRASAAVGFQAPTPTAMPAVVGPQVGPDESGLVTGAPAAPTPGTAIPTAAPIISHGVGALQQTSRMNLGPQIQTYDQWGGEPGVYGANVTEIQPGQQYGDYLARQYGEVTTGPVDMSQYMPTIAGRTSFDYQRESIQGQYDQEQARQLEQLDASLASQGITGGAAIAAKQQMIQQLQQQRAQAMSQVTQSEAQYMQEAAMTEAQRRFSREERLGEQAYTAEMTYASLNQREREIAENARQFDNRYDFDVWAKEQGYTDAERQRVWQAMQNDEDRRLTAADLQLKVDTMKNQLNLDWAQLQTTTGLERDKLLTNIWQTQADIASSERKIAYQAYASERLATLQSQLEQGNWEDQAAIKQRQTSYFAMGKAGIQIPADQLTKLRDSDPLAYYAYLDGMGNLSQAMFDSNMSMRDTWLKASLTSISTLDGAKFIEAMGNVFRTMDTLFGPEGEFWGAQQFLTGEPGQFQVPPAAYPWETPSSTPAPGPTPPVEPTPPPPEEPKVIFTPSYGLNDSKVGEPIHTPLTGKVSLYQGPGEALGTFSMYSQPATYSMGSTESATFINQVANEPVQTIVDAARQNQYLYDDATLRAAAQQLQLQLPSMPPVTTNAGTNFPEDINIKWVMLQKAGRGLSIPLPSGGIRSGGGGSTLAPSFADYVPVDLNYLDQLAAAGDLDGLMNLANTRKINTPQQPDVGKLEGFVNIGGQPFVCYIVPDQRSGQPATGIECTSVMDPNITLNWNVTPQS